MGEREWQRVIGTERAEMPNKYFSTSYAIGAFALRYIDEFIEIGDRYNADNDDILLHSKIIQTEPARIAYGGFAGNATIDYEGITISGDHSWTQADMHCIEIGKMVRALMQSRQIQPGKESYGGTTLIHPAFPRPTLRYLSKDS